MDFLRIASLYTTLFSSLIHQCRYIFPLPTHPPHFPPHTHTHTLHTYIHTHTYTHIHSYSLPVPFESEWGHDELLKATKIYIDMVCAHITAPFCAFIHTPCAPSSPMHVCRVFDVCMSVHYHSCRPDICR